MYAQQQATGGEQFTDPTAGGPTDDTTGAGQASGSAAGSADDDVVDAEIVDETGEDRR
jgi:hypothetical protein